jgi:hypothetical protein
MHMLPHCSCHHCTHTPINPGLFRQPSQRQCCPQSAAGIQTLVRQHTLTRCRGGDADGWQHTRPCWSNSATSSCARWSDTRRGDPRWNDTRRSRSTWCRSAWRCSAWRRSAWRRSAWRCSAWCYPSRGNHTGWLCAGCDSTGCGWFTWPYNGRHKAWTSRGGGDTPRWEWICWDVDRASRRWWGWDLQCEHTQ